MILNRKSSLVVSNNLLDTCLYFSSKCKVNSSNYSIFSSMKNSFCVRKRERMKMNPSDTSLVVLSDTSVVVLSDSDSESEDIKVHTIDESADSDIEVITLNDSNLNQSVVVTFAVDKTPDFIPIGMNVLYNKPKRDKIRRLDASSDALYKKPKRTKKGRFDASPDIILKKRKQSTKQNITSAVENIKPCNPNECTNNKSKVNTKLEMKVSTEIQSKSDVNSENDSIKPRVPQIQLSFTNIHNNIVTPHPAGGLRPIIIDGCNVAFGFGNGKFQIEGIISVVEYFKKRGHQEILCFLPQGYRNKLRPKDINEQIKEYEKENIIIYTPSRFLNGKLIKPHDDRFIIQYASEREGVIISNDGYLDLINEESSWRITIEQRIINFTFARGLLMLPKDPLGPDGPTLDDMLKFPTT